jgi:hypothetical protein
MKRIIPNRSALAILAVLLAIGPICYSQNQTQSANPWKVKFGFYERFRIETWDNSTSLNSSALSGTSYTRTKTNLSAQLIYKSAAEFNIKFGNEFRQYFVSETKPFNINEILFDQLNLKWNANKSILTSITAGRQNISFGEGFIIMDGTPLDGSRTAYFDAFRFDLTFAPKKLLSGFYISQQDKDRFLPVINDKKQALNPQLEQDFGLYTNNDFAKFNLQSYYIRKDSNAKGASPERKLNTLGSRLQYPLGSGLTATVEAAYQFGKVEDIDQSAFGGYGYINWQSQKWLNHPYGISVGAIYLTGDKLSTDDKYEGWDPLYGRYPKWSESYIYTLVNETGVAYWTNLFAPFLKTQYEFSPNVKLLVDYYHLTAPEASNEYTPFPGGTGKTRGELLTTRLTYKLSKTISGHMVWEYFDPGSYYFKNADHANWLRMEFSASL